jgi:hypothetical protein
MIDAAATLIAENEWSCEGAPVGFEHHFSGRADDRKPETLGKQSWQLKLMQTNGAAARPR